MNTRNVYAFLAGMVAAWFIEILSNEGAAVWIDNDKRCSYRFPWSGQCVRSDGHRGVHY